MANFKGSVYEGTRAFTEKQFGPTAVEQILSKLSSPDRDVLRSATAVTWVPVEPVLHYHHELDRLFGSGDFQVCTRAGYFSAGWSINTVLKMFVRLRSPLWLVEKATSVWGRYHDTGKWEVESDQKTRIFGKLTGFEVRDPAFCARLRGWLEGAVALTGGKNVGVTETRCACRGEGACAFSIVWTE